MYESKYLIAEAKKLMSNRKVTYSPHELINDSKCLIAHAEKILNNCEAMHR
jgi:DNA-directed RNA polymerase subunit F